MREGDVFVGKLSHFKRYSDLRAVSLFSLCKVTSAGPSIRRSGDLSNHINPHVSMRHCYLMVPASGSAADQAKHGGSSGSRSPGGVSYLIESEPRD